MLKLGDPRELKEWGGGTKTFSFLFALQNAITTRDIRYVALRIGGRGNDVYFFHDRKVKAFFVMRDYDVETW